MKAQRGLFVSPRAPFEYQKSKEEFSHIILDSEDVVIVQSIFKLFTDVMGITEIVRYLKENNIIPTPIQYAHSKGLTGNYDDGTGAQNIQSIKYILTNHTYTSVLVQGKEKQVVAGTYGHLVDEKIFDMIQKQLQAKTFHTNDSSQSIENILNGRVVCGFCGGKMQRKNVTNHADWYFFQINVWNLENAPECT